MNPETKKRVLILGLDGLTWRLLEPMIADGYLPNLARLKESGAWGVLESTIPPVTAPAWTTFQTGVLPGKHGAIDFNVYTGQSYGTYPVSAADVKLPTLWQRFSDAGKKVVTVNVPVTYPPRAINGYSVSGMLTPNLKTTFTHPPELSAEILERFPEYRVLTPQTVFNTSNLAEFISRCIETEQNRWRVFHYLATEKCPEWDVAMFHVQQLDVVQHAVYWWLDKNGPRFSAAEYAEAVKAYQAVDAIVGQVAALATPETLFVALSDHGHAPIYRTVNTNSLLAGAGLLAFNRNRSGSLLRQAIGLALRLDRWNLNRKLGRSRRRKLVDSLNKGVAVDWPRTKAFMLNGWVWANIYVNLAGREPQGCVQPGAEYEQVRAQVMELCQSLRDPETGQKVFQEVLPGEVAFPGGGNLVPDLIGRPVDGYEFSSSFYQDAGNVFWSNRMKRDHTGSHSMDGIILLDGPEVRPGRFAGGRLVDVFPTVLAWMGVPVPSYGDGVVLGQAFATPPLPSFRQEELPSLPAGGAGQAAFSAEETKEVEERLRALGYM